MPMFRLFLLRDEPLRCELTHWLKTATTYCFPWFCHLGLLSQEVEICPRTPAWCLGPCRLFWGLLYVLCLPSCWEFEITANLSRGSPPKSTSGDISTIHIDIPVAVKHRIYRKEWTWDFPGGPVVKTLPSTAGGAGSIPGWGTKIPHATQSGQKKEKKKEKRKKSGHLEDQFDSCIWSCLIMGFVLRQHASTFRWIKVADAQLWLGDSAGSHLSFQNSIPLDDGLLMTWN